MTVTVTMATMTTFHIIFYIITIWYGNIVILLYGTQLTIYIKIHLQYQLAEDFFLLGNP